MQHGRRQVYFAGARREPFFSEKYDITKHPRYKYLSDADKKNTFDVDRYLSSTPRSRRKPLRYDDLSDEDIAAEAAA